MDPLLNDLNQLDPLEEKHRRGLTGEKNNPDEEGKKVRVWIVSEEDSRSRSLESGSGLCQGRRWCVVVIVTEVCGLDSRSLSRAEVDRS